MIEIQDSVHGVIVPVSAQAGARRTGLVGERGGQLRIAVTAAPEKGKANSAIVKVLSKVLDVPQSAIALIAGETSPRKRFLVTGIRSEQVRDRLADALLDDGK